MCFVEKINQISNGKEKKKISQLSRVYLFLQIMMSFCQAFPPHKNTTETRCLRVMCKTEHTLVIFAKYLNNSCCFPCFLFVLFFFLRTPLQYSGSCVGCRLWPTSCSVCWPWAPECRAQRRPRYCCSTWETTTPHWSPRDPCRMSCAGSSLRTIRWGKEINLENVQEKKKTKDEKWHESHFPPSDSLTRQSNASFWGGQLPSTKPAFIVVLQTTPPLVFSLPATSSCWPEASVCFPPK